MYISWEGQKLATQYRKFPSNLSSKTYNKMEVYQHFCTVQNWQNFLSSFKHWKCQLCTDLGPGCLRDTGVPLPFIYERLVSSVLGPVRPIHPGPAGSRVGAIGLLSRPDDWVIRTPKRPLSLSRGAIITVLIILSNLKRAKDAINAISRLTFNPKYSIYVTVWRNG